MMCLSFIFLGATTDESGNAVTHLMDTFGVQSNLLIAQIINFCLVSYVLYRFAIKPVLKTVEERQKKISEGLQYAEEMKAQLVSAEKERLELLRKAQDEAQSLFTRTKQECEIYLQVQKKATDQKIEQMVKQAQGGIATERQNMLSEVRAEIASLVVSTTERLLKDVLTDDVRARLNDQAEAALEAEQSK